MTPRFVWVWSLALSLFVSPAFAAEDDDFLLDLDSEEDSSSTTRPDDEEEEDEDEDPDEDPDESAAPAPAAVPGAEESPDTPDPSNFLQPLDEAEAFEAEETASPTTLRPGEDNAAIYRAQLDSVAGLSPDEAGLSWEQYLQKYPLSVFRDQIETHMEELSGALYGEIGPDGPVDAGKQELAFAQGMLIEPIDPRSRLRAGFAWGFPNWINLLVDYEKQVNRQLGVHGGFQQRFSGPNLEGGARWAILKDARTNFILTAIGDIHLNLAPIAPGIRPMMAVGKRFGKDESHLDIQGQLGPDLMFFPGQFSPRFLAGLNMTYSPSKTVKIFLESHTYMKDMAWDDGGAFRFNQLAFGLRFVGQRNGKDVYDGAAGASVPYSVNYWRYHYGAVMGDFNYYL